MWKWVAIIVAVTFLVFLQIKLDLIRVADDALKQKLQEVHVSLVLPMQTASSSMSLTSSAFQDGASIPSKYTCDQGSNPLNPPLSISGVPQSATSLVLFVNDPDVPKQLKLDGMFDHWVLFNIPATTTMIEEGKAIGTPGKNGSGEASYFSPCPPKQYEPSEHRYFFTLYALDTMLDLKTGATKDQVQKAMEGHIIAKAELIGKYKRKQLFTLCKHSVHLRPI